LSLRKADLPTRRFEDWAREQIIDHIPGAAHEPE
jgi:hypothetical protein